jgi:glycerol uptake facilitator-like aquaporin
MFGKMKIAMLAAEMLGTGILTLAALTLTHATAITFFTASTIAITFGVLIMLFGPISGGHFNPAVTFGLWTARRVQTLQAIAYIAVQMFGALLAWQLYEYLSDRTIASKNVHFDTHIWLAEVVGAVIFTMGVTAAISRNFDALARAATIAASLFVGIMLAGVASQAILNPAEALGLRSWGSAYVFGPLLGGVLGVNLYLLLFAPESAPTVKVLKKKK